jgi:hypothetical protein
LDYPPRPPYDYDDRDPKRIRGPPPPDLRDPAYGRPLYDDRGPPPRDYDRPFPSDYRREFRRPERSRPHGRYFLIKTPTAENIAKSRETVLSRIVKANGRIVGEFQPKMRKCTVKRSK